MRKLAAVILLSGLLTGMVDPGRQATESVPCTVVDVEYTLVYEDVDYRMWEVKALCLEKV